MLPHGDLRQPFQLYISYTAKKGNALENSVKRKTRRLFDFDSVTLLLCAELSSCLSSFSICRQRLFFEFPITIWPSVRRVNQSELTNQEHEHPLFWESNRCDCFATLYN